MTSRKNIGRRTRSRDPQIIREELLRPSHYLGYDRDEMGCYFLGREAFDLAEGQFRRAAWLNPYEASFKVHWAVSLIKLNRKDEARGVLAEVLQANPNEESAIRLWHRHWPDDSLPPASHEDKPCDF